MERQTELAVWHPRQVHERTARRLRKRPAGKARPGSQGPRPRYCHSSVSGRHVHSTSTRSVSGLLLLWTVTATVCGPVLGSVAPLRITCPTVQPGWLAMVM
jgi:hypothetical protein